MRPPRTSQVLGSELSLNFQQRVPRFYFTLHKSRKLHSSPGPARRSWPTHSACLLSSKPGECGCSLEVITLAPASLAPLSCAHPHQLGRCSAPGEHQTGTLGWYLSRAAQVVEALAVGTRCGEKALLSLCPIPSGELKEHYQESSLTLFFCRNDKIWDSDMVSGSVP